MAFVCWDDALKRVNRHEVIFYAVRDPSDNHTVSINSLAHCSEKSCHVRECDFSPKNGVEFLTIAFYGLHFSICNKNLATTD